MDAGNAGFPSRRRRGRRGRGGRGGNGGGGGGGYGDGGPNRQGGGYGPNQSGQYQGGPNQGGPNQVGPNQGGPSQGTAQGPYQGQQGPGYQNQGNQGQPNQGQPYQNQQYQNQQYQNQQYQGQQYQNQRGPYSNGQGHQQNGSPSQPSTPAPQRYLDVDGRLTDMPVGARRFDELTSIDPQPRLTLEYPGCPASCRLIDLFCPIGRGQRSLIVSPPKAGKTTLLKDIAGAILRNHPDVEVVVLLVDERPEEVTDFRRTFTNPQSETLARDMLARGEAAFREAGVPVPAPATPAPIRCRVVASSNDHTIEKHVEVSTTTIDRCKKMVEAGKHVVVLLDSLTRLGRAFNNSRRHASSGRTMTGGLDSKALEVPRQLFGSARNTEEAGSLTIIASCLVDTGSAADQVIFEEFKGSGNMELILDRKISERRLFPAINLAASGTRKEHLLMPEQELKTVTALRRRLLAMHPHQQVEQLLAALQRFPTNAALVGSVQG